MATPKKVGDDNSSLLPPEDLTPTRPSQITVGPLGVARILVRLFSRVGQREPPTPKKTRHIRFITIGISHFCEKVRWGLDVLEKDPDSPYYYTEDAHPPPFLSFETLPVTKGKASASPMLVMDDSRVMYKSNVILQELCPFWYPQDIREKVMKMERDLGQRLGASTRCLVYHYLFQKRHHTTCVKLCCVGTSRVEHVLYEKMLDKGIVKAMRKLLDINEATAATSQEEIRKVFAEVSNRLENNGGAYIMDVSTKKSFGLTAADVTFCSLAQVLIRPPEMAAFSVDDFEMPPKLLQLGEELRATTAGQHVLKIYQKHRILSKGSDRVEIKTTGRNHNPLREILFGVGVVAAAVGAVICYRRN